jgi:polysaccharide export outer membrane protein
VGRLIGRDARMKEAWNGRMSKRISLIPTLCLVLVMCLGGCASPPPLPPLAPPAPLPEPVVQGADTAAYIIGPEDALDIVVYGHEDLSLRVAVSPDGGFTYPLLDRVVAAGLTTGQLERHLAKALLEYLVDPQVSVTVVEFRSQPVHVVGEVRKPGTYVLRHASTLREILAEAGGPTPDAGQEVMVLRAAESEGSPGSTPSGTQGKRPRIRVDLEALLRGEWSQPIPVYGGDTIYVTKAAFFYVSGEVKQPGRYKLDRDTTVAKALALASGMTPFAATKRLKIRRLVEGRRQEFRAGLTDLLQADDELIVPESFF